MAAITSIIAGIGLAAGVVGAGTQLYGSMQQAEAQKKSFALSQQAESARKRAMDLDSQRKSFSIIREQQMARAQALANATSGGAQFGSGLQGGYGQISGASGNNYLGQQQNQEIGTEMFAINGAKGGSDANSAAAGSLSATGSGISSLGNMLVKDSGTIAKIGGWA